MNYASNILETIGKTPMVKLNRITIDIPSIVSFIKEQYKSKCIMLKRTRYNSQLSQNDLDLLKIYTYINNRLILAE